MPHRPVGRPRRSGTDDRIVTATQELIRENGPEAVNVAAVSARSGVARTTIYRRYTDRTDLLQAALRPAVDPGPAPEDVPVREKLVWVLARTQEVLDGSIGPGGLAAVLTGRDQDFAAALRGSLQQAVEPIERQITDDVAAGRLGRHAEADLVMNLVLGSYLAELVRHGSARPDWVERTADLLAVALT